MKRLIAFHHTMAPAGGSSPDSPTLSSVWHEGEAGRSGVEMACVILQLIRESHLSTKESLIIWCDNCVAQNKNYTLFNALTSLINSEETAIKKLSLKFFVSGHTFMAADSVHRNVEHQMKLRKDVVSIDDFSACVGQATTNSIVLRPDPDVFVDLPTQHAIRKNRPRLDSLVEVRFRRGRRTQCKLRFADPYQKFKFLHPNVAANFQLAELPQLREGVRGVSKELKESIAKDLIPLLKTLHGGKFLSKVRFFEKLKVRDSHSEMASEGAQSSEEDD